VEEKPLSNACKSPMEIKIAKCPSCGREHLNRPVTLLATPQPPFTHWYTCPETGDPVSMSLFMVDDQTAVAVPNQILQRVLRCLLSKRWMIACFRVEGGRVWLEPDPVLFHDFPNGDFGVSIGMLYDSIKRFLKTDVLGVPAGSGLSEHKITDVPMPPAPAAAHKVTLFGDDDRLARDELLR
jgi:hypothetical protein